uniref:Uncharacterized protein n=1 Tax=Rhizophora mucronata TaxID=61149 RepID=A0A2P2QUH7_RHIMU
MVPIYNCTALCVLHGSHAMLVEYSKSSFVYCLLQKAYELIIT